MYFIKLKYYTAVLSTACLTEYMMSISQLNIYSSNIVATNHRGFRGRHTPHLSPTLALVQCAVLVPFSAQDREKPALSFTAVDNPQTTFVLDIFCHTWCLSHGNCPHGRYLLFPEITGRGNFYSVFKSRGTAMTVI